MVEGKIERFRGYARDLLQRRMSDISEERWCAGWLMGLEYILWAEAIEGGELLQLAQDAGGWWSWPDDLNEPVFVPLDAWKIAYEDLKVQGDAIR